MIPRRISVLFLFVAMSALCVFANDESPKISKLTDLDRQNIIRTFMAENVFVSRLFPAGKVGLRIQDGKVTPSDEEVRAIAAANGPAAKPGDRARITDVRFVRSGIIFEINGGPVKRKKWYERVQVGVGDVSTSPTGQQSQDDAIMTNARGSFVLLGFKDYTPSLTTDQIKEMLSPVFDFKAASVAEAYVKALPPKIADAVKNHRALVGMDREMVTYAMGRPPKRYRDREGTTDYEEWIYGEPPKEVQFIRFVGDKVARIEVMAIDGQKIVRTENEVGDLNGQVSAVAQKSEEPKPAEEEQQQSGRRAPSLMRPGEKPGPEPQPGAAAPVRLPPADAPGPDAGQSAPQPPH
jgi:hypothetical protein